MGSQVDLVRDVLDQGVVDRDGRAMGRVDGVVMECGAGPPRVTALLIGPSALGWRLHPRLGRLIDAIERCCGIAQNRPCRVPVEDVTDIGRSIRVRLSVDETAVAAFEQWLRRWIVRLPGSQ